ncbi:uncharacterized protein LOC111717824 [Eurytemora carolleeae]|uniref:uncharacterized protein LOC111717824 n=1 Tax=Eurytemora carolleeae TaxID=1294199 RepID=UPI000C7912E0|nr:uncharacterized protein LOC111717824 [Eurytemora carolleeae]|eukprot:XP_023349038.1 uncharacterized protein LOC111717824 [Eurytemora affinis]
MKLKIILLHFLCTVFTAAWDEKVLHEMELVKTLKEFSNQLQNSLDNIHKYTHEVNKIYAAECPEANCSQDFMVDKIVGNPIYNYQVLKRILVSYKKIEESINKIDTKGSLTHCCRRLWRADVEINNSF